MPTRGQRSRRTKESYHRGRSRKRACESQISLSLSLVEAVVVVMLCKHKEGLAGEEEDGEVGFGQLAGADASVLKLLGLMLLRRKRGGG